MKSLELQPVEINGITYQAEIGVIDNTFLGIEDHGILTFLITINFGGSFQGAGTYSLDGYNKKTGKREGSPAMAILIRDILEVVGVDNWEALKRQKVVVLREKHYDTIRGFVSVPPSDFKYVIFADIFAECFEEDV